MPHPSRSRRRPTARRAERKEKAGMNKQETKKIVLGGLALMGLLYVYFSFFLGPLNKSRHGMQAQLDQLQGKLSSSQAEIGKVAKLEENARAATSRYDALRSLSPDGAPIAWFPPRIRAFFAGYQVEKTTARLESTASFNQPELADWSRYVWVIDLPQADFGAVGKSIALLENTNPL